MTPEGPASEGAVPKGFTPERVAYFGTPEIAADVLCKILERGYEVPLVVTRPDAGKGRGKKLSPSPVKSTALELGLEISHNPSDVIGLDADMGVVVAFGEIIKKPTLNSMSFVNIHFSMLPKWRGAAPLERAILEGDKTTGVCLMALEETLDTGPIYASSEVSIEESDNLGSLRKKMTQEAAFLLLDCMENGFPDPVPQKGEPTWAEKIKTEELYLDWNLPADVLIRKVKIGRAWTLFRGKRMMVKEAEVSSKPEGLPPGEIKGDICSATGGGLRLLYVQMEGKKEMSFREWQKGARLSERERLGS